MSGANLGHRIVTGVRRKPLRLAVSAFVVYATIWTVIEPLLGLIEPVKLHIGGWPKYWVFVFISILIGLLRSAAPQEVTLRQGSSIVRITFGDLFANKGLKVIPVSRFFLETEVVSTSLQGKVIDRFIRSREGNLGLQEYQNALAAFLDGKEHEEVFRAALQKVDRFYPLGTTALIECQGDQFLLFALTKTELKGQIPSDNCQTTDLWIALQRFWSEARIHARGKPVCIPLIGGGTAGIKLLPSQLLEMNLLALADALADKGKITTEEVIIVLHQSYLEQINLDNFKRLWG